MIAFLQSIPDMVAGVLMAAGVTGAAFLLFVAHHSDKRRGTHKHKCEECGTVWRHPDHTVAYRAHDCPECGAEQYWKYRGPEEPR